jgi:hypothetical protein
MTTPLIPQDQPPPLPTDDTALLLHYLQSHDAPCPLCKYNLRNLTQPRCPECGRELRLNVGIVEQNFRPYVALLTSVLLPAGMGLITWAGTIHSGGEIYSHMSGFELIALISFQIAPFAAMLALALRRGFLRLELPVQRTLAVLAALGCLILYGYLFSRMFY